MKPSFLLLFLACNIFCFAQSGDAIIPLYSNCSKASFKLEVVEKKLSAKEKAKGKFEKIKLYCRDSLAFEGEALSYQNYTVYLANGCASLYGIETRKGQIIYFSENGKLPLPDDLVIKEYFGNVWFNYVNLLWFSKHYAETKTDSLILYNLSCKSVSEFFANAYNSGTDKLIVEKNGLKSIYMAGKDEAVVYNSNFLEVLNPKDWIAYNEKRNAWAVKYADGRINIFDNKGEKINHYPAVKLNINAPWTESRLIYYSDGELLGFESLVDSKIYVQPQFDAVFGKPGCNAVAVKKTAQKNFAFINNRGKIITDFLYQFDLEDGGYSRVICKKDGKTGVIEDNGTIRIPFEYFYIKRIWGWSDPAKTFRSAPAFAVKKNPSDKYAVITEYGKLTSAFIYDEIKLDEYSENLLAFRNGSKDLYRFNGEKIYNTALENENAADRLIINFNKELNQYEEDERAFFQKWNEIVEKKFSTDGGIQKELKKLIDDKVPDLLQQLSNLKAKLVYNKNNYKESLSPKQMTSLQRSIEDSDMRINKLENLKPDVNKSFEIKTKE